MSDNGNIHWIKDEVGARSREWEEFYRNRWQYDKVVRSTHGVNCTGSCTWQIHVKDGIVTSPELLDVEKVLANAERDRAFVTKHVKLRNE